MKRKRASSGTSSENRLEELMRDFSIYDVPTANLDARAKAYELLKHPDVEVRTLAEGIIEHLTLSIRAMGRDDIGLVITHAEVEPAA